MLDRFEVGDIVRSQAFPEWGLGQVQSSLAGQVTITFEHQGKLVLKDNQAALEIVSADWL
jgi:hypothetical protein